MPCVHRRRLRAWQRMLTLKIMTTPGAKGGGALDSRSTRISRKKAAKREGWLSRFTESPQRHCSKERCQSSESGEPEAIVEWVGERKYSPPWRVRQRRTAGIAR